MKWKSETIKRLRSRTPAYFKRVRNVSMAIAGACGSVVALWGQLPEAFTSAVPQWVVSGITFAAVGSTVVSQLTKVDKDWEDEK